MGKSILTLAVDALNAGGVRAEMGYPGRKMPALTQTAAAVSLHRVDMQQRLAVVQVTVAAPVKLGAEICQETALLAGQILRDQGADCLLSECVFEGQSELFLTQVTAEFSGTALAGFWEDRAGFSAELAGLNLESLVSFTAQRATDSTVTELENAKWQFELEEFFTPEAPEEISPEEPFTLRVFQPYQSESYLNCSWTEQRRVTERTGTRQIRKGIAQSRMVAEYT